MPQIRVPLTGREYTIYIERGAMAKLGARMGAIGLRGSVALVQDAAVAPLYGPPAQSALEEAGFRVVPITVPAGEASKSLRQLGELYRDLAGAGLDRDSVVVALGGGVVGDLAGFAAASYLRGIDLVQVPTTLLAQVDSSVGGKTGIDLPEGKNLVGAFHQPRLVSIDLDTLDTLPHREYRAGLAEVVKYGIIMDEPFFGNLESNREAILGHQTDALERLVARSCEIKAEVVGQDERESGLRAILNFGHTIGHAVETAAGYGEYSHGEAISIGMAAAAWLSQRQSAAPAEEMARLERLLIDYGLPVRLRNPLPVEALLRVMYLDKKTRGAELRFVLARRLGQVSVQPVSEALAREAARYVGALD